LRLSIDKNEFNPPHFAQRKINVYNNFNVFNYIIQNIHITIGWLYRLRPESYFIVDMYFIVEFKQHSHHYYYTAERYSRFLKLTLQHSVFSFIEIEFQTCSTY